MTCFTEFPDLLEPRSLQCNLQLDGFWGSARLCLMPCSEKPICKCAHFAATRYDDGCARDCGTILLCSRLHGMGDRCLSYRLYLSLVGFRRRLQSSVQDVGCGVDKDTGGMVADCYCGAVKGPLDECWRLSHCSPLRPIRQANMVFVWVDRNPGRVVLMCKALWLQLQDRTFASCARYAPSSSQPLCGDTPTFVKDTIDEFQKFIVDATGIFVPVRTPAGACRPRGYCCQRPPDSAPVRPGPVRGLSRLLGNVRYVRVLFLCFSGSVY